jgi:hypothetical protein
MAYRLAVAAQFLCVIVVAYGVTADILQSKGAWIVAALAAATAGLTPQWRQSMSVPARRPVRRTRGAIA